MGSDVVGAGQGALAGLKENTVPWRCWVSLFRLGGRADVSAGLSLAKDFTLTHGYTPDDGQEPGRDETVKKSTRRMARAGGIVNPTNAERRPVRDGVGLR